MISNPFVYPKTRHRRKLHPPASARYSTYKPYLKEEFQSQCVYCRLPDGLKGEDTFGVDHYRPQSKFPDLKTDYANLFYACNCCNRRKGAFWPTDVQLRTGQFIPNPCDHTMFDHLRYRSTAVEPRTNTGAFTEQMLMLNDENSLKYRNMVLDVVKVLDEKRRRLIDTLSRINHMIIKQPENVSELESESIAVQKDIDRVVDHLKTILGKDSNLSI